MSRLQRFKDAQDQKGAGFEAALDEIRGGAKRGHWIWYVFPQLAGLGHSTASRLYGIEGVSEAEEYLKDPLLRSRFVTIAAVVAEHVSPASARPLERLMGSSIDVAKLVSSVTLFGQLAKRLAASEGLADYEGLARAAGEILAAAEAEGYPRCEFTLRHLTGSQ
jgi:uncharacterized protein (DUF1810 family)